MGAWSVSIMGNDTALDLKEEYKSTFSMYSPEEAVEKLDKYCEKELGSDEMHIYYYSVAHFMWEHGILIKLVKDRAIDWIDSDRGLELYAEAGASILKKRKAILQQLKEKLNSPMPPVKKIKVEPITIFEIGDIITLKLTKKLSEMDKWKQYLLSSATSKEQLSAEIFARYDEYYCVVQKVHDGRGKVQIDAGIYPYYILFNYLEARPPEIDDIRKAKVISDKPFQIFEKTLFHWKKRGYQIVKNDMVKIKPKKIEKEIIKDHQVHYSPCTYLHIDFDAFVLRQLLSKHIIKR